MTHTLKVEGAGTHWCNGVYRVSPDTARIPQSAYREISTRIGPWRVSGSSPIEEEDFPKYTYQARDGPLMTLFRCKMRTKAYWWFIRWVFVCVWCAVVVSFFSGLPIAQVLVSLFCIVFVMFGGERSRSSNLARCGDVGSQAGCFSRFICSSSDA